MTPRAVALRASKRRLTERLTEMDEEKMQRQMEFIVEQQAQFAAKIGQLEDTTRQIGESVVRLGEDVTRLVGVVERVVDTVARLAQVTTERFQETDRKIAALVDSQIQTEEVMRKLGERMDNLAATVDRHIAEGHDGRARPES